MNNENLLELIRQAEERGGGLLLNLDNKPAAVVLTVEKYNELVNLAEGRQLGNEYLLTENFLANQTLFDDKQTEKKGQRVLVTGGAGYIGAHVTRQLLAAGFEVVVLDNLSTGKRENVLPEAVFVEGDLSDINLLKDLFAVNQFSTVIHLAASIEVEESVVDPVKYFENNAINTAKLLSVMNEYSVKKIIFSSTCAVYDAKDNLPLSELSDTKPTSPYGSSKLLAEDVLKYYAEHLKFQVVTLRYFNACGCEWMGQIRATHESHLLPKILEVAAGKKPYITVNGNNYGTIDGTCIRDYVHVLDIANAHVMVIEKMMHKPAGFFLYNIGTGKGCSVLEMINTVSEILNKMIPMEIGPRRKGDVAVLVADNNKIQNELEFKLRYSDLETIIQTAWRQMNCASEESVFPRNSTPSFPD